MAIRIRPDTIRLLARPQDPERQNPERQDPQPAPPLDDAARLRAIDESIQERAEQRSRDFLTSFRLSVRADPEMAAEAQRAARELGIGEQFVEQNLDVAREVLKRRSLRYEELRRHYPTLLEQLQDVGFQRIAHDDLDNLRATESTFGTLGRQFRAGRAVNERGYIGVRKALGMATPPELDRLAEIDLLLGEAAQDSGIVASVTEVLGQMSGTVPIAIGAGAAAAAPAAAGGPVSAGGAFAFGSGAALFTMSGLIEGGNAYLDMTEKGYDHATAAQVAFGVGLVNGALELVGARYVAKPFASAILRKGGRELAEGLARETAGAAFQQFVREYAKGFAGEVSTEVLQEVSALVGDEIARVRSGSDLPGVFESGEAGQRLADVFVKTAQAMSVLSAPGPTLHYLADAARARRAGETAQLFQRLVESAGESKVAARNPESYERFVDAAATQADAQTVYVDAEALEGALRQSGVPLEDLQRLLPDVARQLPQALRDGDDVTLPTGQFAARLARTKLGQALLPHLRLDPDAMSLAEAETFQQARRERLEDASRESAARAEVDRQVFESAREVEETIRRQIVETGAVPADEARVAAKLWREFASVQARRLGILPGEFHQRFPLQVVRTQAGPGEGELSQAAPEGEDAGADVRAGETQAQPEQTQPPGDPAAAAGDAAPTPAVPDAAGGPADGKRAGRTGRVPDAGEPGPSDTFRAGGSRGFFSPQRLLIALTQAADATTFLHEAAHAFLTIYADLAAQPGAPAQITADMQVLLDWFGVPDLATWQAMSVEQQRQHHEQFAYSFEAYLADGTAPSLELQGIFDRFRSWLLRVYRSIRDELGAIFRRELGRDLPPITDEVRAVFDRMLASEDQIARAEAVRGLQPFFQSREDALAAGMTEEQWQEHQQRLEESRAAAVAETDRESLGVVRRLRGARARIARQIDEQEAKTRAELREQVELQVEREPVYRARAWIERGELVDDEGNRTTSEGSHKLRTEDLRRMFPERSPERRRYQRLVAQDGVPADVAAPMFGFASGEQMVRALLDAPPLETRVDQLTDDRMAQEHPGLSDPTQREAAIELALANEARVRFTAVELRALTRARQPVRLLTHAARLQAQQTLEARAVRDISVRRHNVAQGRAAREARRLRGDPAAAANAVRQQLLQAELARQSKLAIEEVGRALRGFRPVWRSDKDLAERRNVDMVAAARAILAQFGLSRGDQLPLTHLDAVREYEPGLYADLQPLVIRATQGARHWRDLTLGEFRILRDTVTAIMHRARRMQEMRVEGRRERRQQIVEQLRLRLDEIGIPAQLPGEQAAATRRQRAGFALLNVRAGLRRVEHWALAMDGGTPGPFTRYVWREVRTRLDDYRADKTRYVERLRDIVQRLDLPRGQIDAPELLYTFQGKADLIGALLHAGNQSNLRKNLIGRGWGQELEDGTLDASRWWRFVDRMQEEGRLTKADFDAVQAIWDLLEEIKPLSQRTHMELYGYRFEPIEPTPLRTKFGVYRGGYVPAKADRDLVPQVRQHDLIEELEGDWRQSLPSTGKGHTISRTAVTRPLSLDVRLVVAHVDEALRFAHVQPAIRDVLALLRDPELERPLGRVDRSAIADMLLPWLTRAARQTVEEPGRFRAVDAFWRFVRRAQGQALMFGNVVNAAQQVTGVSNATTMVRAGHLRSAFWHYIGSPRDTARQIAAWSPFMADRLENQVGSLQQDLHEMLLSPGLWGRIQLWTTKHSYFMQRFAQNQVDITTWLGAYDQAMADLGAQTADVEAHREAVARADAAVRVTQGSGQPEDVAGYEQGSPFVRSWTQFTGYFNVVLNQMLAARSLSEAASVTLRAFTVPMLWAGAIAGVLWGDVDDPDDDGFVDEAAEWFFGSLASGAVSLIPGFGPAIAAAGRSVVGESAQGSRLAMSPSISALESAVRTVRRLTEAGQGDELTGRQIRDALTLLAVSTGIPVSVVGRPLGYAVDVERGDVEPTSGIDYLRGLVTGRASEASRR